MNFKVGDVAVYPGKGVGRIHEIKTRAIPGLPAPIQVYVVHFPSNAKSDADITSTLEVPLRGSATKRLRGVMPLDEIQKLQDILKLRDVEPSNQTWNRRYREYMSKIATGEPVEIAEVLRDLALLKIKKNLSFGERKMYDQAMALLIEEWVHTLKTYDPNYDSTQIDTLRSSIEETIENIFKPDIEAAKALEPVKKGKGKGKKTNAANQESKTPSQDTDPSSSS